jgi:hypothetical protein
MCIDVRLVDEKCSSGPPLFSYLEFGSAGVIVIRSDTITVGADSRSSIGDTTKDNACKVIATNNTIFVCTGLLKIDTFSTCNEARRVINMSGDIRRKIEVFDRKIKDLFTIAFNRPKCVDSIRYSRNYRNNMNTESAFCTFIGGEPLIFFRAFRPRFDGKRIIIDTESIDYRFDSSKALLYCKPINCETISDSLTMILKSYLQWSPPEIIIRLIIHDQMKKRPGVGGDIDIVQLTQDNRPKWIYRKKCCAN